MARCRRLLLLFAALSACGGSVTSPQDVSDANLPDSSATPTDGGDAVSPSCTGSCVGGDDRCSSDGSICTCNPATDRWECRACIPAWAGDDCPPQMLCEQSSCAGHPLGIGCGYPNGCGGIDVASCLSAGWTLTAGACAEGCPREEPIRGSRCDKEGSHCDTASTCGGRLEVDCVEGRWAVFEENPTCPTIICSSTPVAGEKCDLAGSRCEFKNSCGGRDLATCFAGRWKLESGVCCPDELPAEGATCSAPSRVPCRYDSPRSECYCEPDGKFHCMKVPTACAEGLDCSPGYACKPSSEIYCACREGQLKCESRFKP